MNASISYSFHPFCVARSTFPPAIGAASATSAASLMSVTPSSSSSPAGVAADGTPLSFPGGVPAAVDSSVPHAGLPSAGGPMQQVILVNEHGMPVGQTFVPPGQTFMPQSMTSNPLYSTTTTNPLVPAAAPPPQPPSLLSQPALVGHHVTESPVATPSPHGGALPATSVGSAASISGNSLVAASSLAPAGGKATGGKKKGKKAPAKELHHPSPLTSSGSTLGLKAPPGATIVLNENPLAHDTSSNDSSLPPEKTGQVAPAPAVATRSVFAAQFVSF